MFFSFQKGKIICNKNRFRKVFLQFLSKKKLPLDNLDRFHTFAGDKSKQVCPRSMAG
jgi:hypothetical protein